MNTRIENLKKKIEELAEDIESTENEIDRLKKKLDELEDYLNDKQFELETKESELFSMTDPEMEKIKDDYYDRIFETDDPCNIVYLDLCRENPDILKDHIKTALGR